MPTAVGPVFRLNFRPAIRKLSQIWREAGRQGRREEVRQRLDAVGENNWCDFSERISLRDVCGPYTHINVRLCAPLRELASELKRQRHRAYLSHT